MLTIKQSKLSKVISVSRQFYTNFEISANCKKINFNLYYRYTFCALHSEGIVNCCYYFGELGVAVDNNVQSNAIFYNRT